MGERRSGEEDLVANEKYGRWMSALRGEGTSTEQPFDELASGLASRTISRRRALQLAGASLLGAAGLVGSARVAEAKPTCPRRGAGCCRRCRETNKSCVCVRNTAGNRLCVYRCCPTVLEGCEDNADCAASGTVCVRKNQVSSCCTIPITITESGVCMYRCRHNPAPEATECVFYSC